MFKNLSFLLLVTVSWFYYPPIRQVNNPNLGKLLSDIESHMPKIHIYRDNDKVTWAHETCHGIHSNIQKKYKKDGYYLFGNAAVQFISPKTTLKRISQLTRYQGGVYSLYLIQQRRYWNKEPLYILNEWICYTNGSWVGIELNLDRGDSLEYALEFNFYAEALQKAIEQDDPYYEDKENLWNFINWNTQRTFALVKLAKTNNMFRIIHEQLQRKFQNPAENIFIIPTPGEGCKLCRKRINDCKK